MKFTIPLIIFGFLISITFGSYVLDFSGPHFEDRVKEHDTILIEFFSPSYVYFKKLEQEYEQAAASLKAIEPSISFAKVDCTAKSGEDTCNRYDVEEYPTLKVFKNGNVASVYNGPPDSDGIIKYMKGQVSPSSRELLFLEDVDKFLKDETAVIGYFSDPSGSLREEFIKAAAKLRKSVTFGHTFMQEILKKYGFSDDIVLYRPKIFWNKFKPKYTEIKYTGSADKEKIIKFVKDNYHGLVGHRTVNNYDEFKTPLVIIYYDVDYVKNVRRIKYLRSRILKIARKYKDQLTIAVSRKDKFSAEVKDFGLSTKGYKPVVAAKNAKNQKFNMKEEFSIKNFVSFVKQFLNGTLEPLPEKNYGPVKVAVAQNFTKLVLDNEKDVLVEFYAPWCPHCKQLAPIYEKLGKEMKNENVEIVKMDATANNIPPNFKVQGYPTLYWVPRNYKSSPKEYEGDRNLSDFISYIAEHATDELKRYDRSGKRKW